MGRNAVDYYLNSFRVSSGFGPRNGGTHYGTDFAGLQPGQADGKKILAVTGGQVTNVYTNPNAEVGYGVEIKGNDGRTYRYVHMKTLPPVKKGDTVNGGAMIGVIGSTGDSSGPHLDLKVIENGKFIDPYKFLTSAQSTKKTGTIETEGKTYAAANNSSTKANTKLSYTNTWKIDKEGKKSSSYKTYKSNLDKAAAKGVIPKDANTLVALSELIGRESTWNPNAKNPKSTAHGYGQFLDSTRANMKKKYPQYDYSDPVDQIILTYLYAKDRYGSVDKALQFWDKNKYY